MTARRFDDDVLRQLESLARGERLPASMMTIEHPDVDAAPRGNEPVYSGPVHSGPLDLPTAPHLNDRIEVDFASSALPGRVIWTNGVECGVALDRKMDGYALMARMATGVRADAPAGGQASAPVSPTAAEPDDGFRPGLRVKVVLEGGDERSAVVNWAKDHFAALVLED